MPHVEDLASDLQTALLKSIVGPLRVECILDPSGVNVNLSSYLNGADGLTIRKAKSIQPYGELGKFQVGEVRLKMLNKSDFFNSNLIGKQFYYAYSRLYEDKASGDTYVRITDGDGPKFDHSGITQVTVDDGTNKVTFTISSIDETPAKYDQINFTSSGSQAFSAGAVVETIYLPGKEVTLKTTIDGATTKISQFAGLLKSHPDLQAGAAEIFLQDKIKTILDIDCKANSYQLITNAGITAQTTVSYNRAGSSDGELDLDDSIIYPGNGCPIGEWEIVFTSATAYTITDPFGDEYTALVTYDPASFPNASSPYLEIFAAAWSGTFEEDDEITFETVLTFGKPVNNYTTIPKMLRQLLVGDEGADLALAEINDTNFQSLITSYSSAFAAISFQSPLKVLKALETLQQHINGTIFSDPDGLIDINLYRPRYVSASVKSLSPDADIMELKQDDLGRIDRIKVLYDFDYVDNKFLKELEIPDGSPVSRNELELRLPAYHSEAQARATGERIWVKWRKGVKAYQIREKFNYGAAFEIGDLILISSEHPEFASRAVEIYEVEKDLINGEVTAIAYDLNYAFMNFCFYDVGDDYDTGKLYW